MLANELLAYESMNKIYRASAQPVAVEPRVVAVEPRVELIHYTRIESDYRIEHRSGEALHVKVVIYFNDFRNYRTFNCRRSVLRQLRGPSHI